MKKVMQGWRLILDVLYSLVKALLQTLELLWELLTGRKERGRSVDCFNKPDMRPQPDPYIYSQWWLFSRGLAFTWDNPDFSILDPKNGLPVDNHDLKPNTKYVVRTLIHNGSIMDAVSTLVGLEVLLFGAGTSAIQQLGIVTIPTIPGFGAATADFEWTTPATAGHNCLRVGIYNADDANPFNNVGQHNTDVAVPASPTRKVKFHIGNQSKHRQTFVLSLNSYRLPADPLRPGPPPREGAKVVNEMPPRDSTAYLNRLRRANDFAKFPVPSFLHARLADEQLTLGPAEQRETFVEMLPAAAGTGRQPVNVNVMLDGMLVGGITAYVEET